MKNGRIKFFLNFSGSTLSLFSIIFIIFKMIEYGDEISLDTLGVAQWLSLLLLSAGYGLSGFLLALSWHKLLMHLGLNLGRRNALRIYGVSQLARYIPGNFFHLVSRQGLGAAEGLPNWPLAKSALWELSFISLTAAPFVILVLPTIWSTLNEFVTTSIFLTIFIILLVASKTFFSAHVTHAIIYYLIFLTLSGLIFTCGSLFVIANLNFFDLGTSIFFLFTAAYIVAWLAGFLTPGAPAGFGIREAILYALLHNQINQEDLLVAIALGRLVTVSGDFLFYIIANSINKK